MARDTSPTLTCFNVGSEPNDDRRELARRRFNLQVGLDQLRSLVHPNQPEMVLVRQLADSSWRTKTNPVIMDCDGRQYVLESNFKPFLFSLGMATNIGKGFLGTAV